MPDILAIDPGTTESAFAQMSLDPLRLSEFGKIDNNELLARIPKLLPGGGCAFAIEMVASFGMPVGKEVFETVFWIGRFWEAAGQARVRRRIYRKADVCMNLCKDARAKDGNIRQALIDRFGPVGVKAKPGPFYGVSKDVWSAIAVGVTYWDRYGSEA